MVASEPERDERQVSTRKRVGDPGRCPMCHSMNTYQGGGWSITCNECCLSMSKHAWAKAQQTMKGISKGLAKLCEAMKNAGVAVGELHESLVPLSELYGEPDEEEELA